MNQDSEQERANSAIKKAVHVSAPDSSEKKEGKAPERAKKSGLIGEKSFWRGLQLARTKSAKGAFRGRRYSSN